MIGKSKVYFDNSDVAESDVGSNGNVELRNSVEVKASGSHSQGAVLLEGLQPTPTAAR